MNKIIVMSLLCLSSTTFVFCQQVLSKQSLSIKAINYTKSHSLVGYTHLNSTEIKVSRADSTWGHNFGSNNGGVKCFAFDARESMLVMGSYNGALELWDLKKGVLLWSVMAHDSQVNDVKFSGNDNILVTCSTDKKVRLFRPDNGGFIKEYVFSSPVNSIEFHPAKKDIFITGDHEGNISYWNIATEKPVRVIKAHASYVFDLEFCSHGDKVLSSSHDGTIKTWDFDSGKLLNTSAGHTRAVYSIAVSPDEKTFASGGFDKKIGIWNLQTGKNIKYLTGHSDYINVVRYMPEGSLLSGSRDGTLRLWENLTQ
jgi:WD40 repeat protein